MDHVGIGLAMRGVANAYFAGSRRTGRTTALLDSVKDGDRICCFDSREAERLRRLLRERNLDVECMVVPIENPQDVFRRGTSKGRTIFEHGWVEQFYLATLERAQKDIDFLQTQASGYGEAHRETRRSAERLYEMMEFVPVVPKSPIPK